MSKFIHEPLPKSKKGAKKMSKAKALELPAETNPKTIKLNIRVKTLVITLALLASHALAFWAGVQAPSTYDRVLDRLTADRAPAPTPAPAPVSEPKSATSSEPAQLKASQ